MIVYATCYNYSNHPVAKFLSPDWGDRKANSSIGLSDTGPPGYIGWQAGTTTLSRVNYNPPVHGTMYLCQSLFSDVFGTDHKPAPAALSQLYLNRRKTAVQLSQVIIYIPSNQLPCT
jgi:hypothetical protein